MDKFTEMQTFAAVVEAGSFTQAAQSLGSSKAAVSRYVGDLETRLGVRLLQRTTRRLSLTQEGQVFYARCSELLNSLDEAEAEVTARAGQAVGELKIAAPLSFGVLHLAPLWPQFMSEHPNVTLDVDLADRVVNLVEEGYDMAIRIARLPASSLISRRLSATRMVLCASPRYVRQYGQPQRPQDLASHRIIGYTLASTGHQWQFESDEGPTSVEVKPSLKTNSGDTCVAAAVLGQGIVLQPTFLVGQHLRAGTLIELMPQYQVPQLGIYAVYPSRKFVRPKVRLMIDFLVHAFAQAQWDNV